MATSVLVRRCLNGDDRSNTGAGGVSGLGGGGGTTDCTGSQFTVHKMTSGCM